MAKCIMRVEPKKIQAAGGLEAEANREMPASHYKNAVDPSRTKDNILLVSSPNWRADIQAAISGSDNAKQRKNSNVLITGYYSASPDWFLTHSREEMIEYFKECTEWHARHFGVVINAAIHLDETTPHLQIASVPITSDGRLCASDLLGKRDDYKARQTRFWLEVGRKHGLKRGRYNSAKSGRRHEEEQEYAIRRDREKLAQQEAEIARLEEEKKRQQKAIEERREAEEKLAQKIYAWLTAPEGIPVETLRELAKLITEKMQEMEALHREADELKALAEECRRQIHELGEAHKEAQEELALLEQEEKDWHGPMDSEDPDDIELVRRAELAFENAKRRKVHVQDLQDRIDRLQGDDPVTVFEREGLEQELYDYAVSEGIDIPDGAVDHASGQSRQDGTAEPEAEAEFHPAPENETEH